MLIDISSYIPMIQCCAIRRNVLGFSFQPFPAAVTALSRERELLDTITTVRGSLKQSVRELWDCMFCSYFWIYQRYGRWKRCLWALRVLFYDISRINVSPFQTCVFNLQKCHEFWTYEISDRKVEPRWTVRQIPQFLR
jgi:hypothetical protein